jgi:hypothetical protein
LGALRLTLGRWTTEEEIRLAARLLEEGHEVARSEGLSGNKIAANGRMQYAPTAASSKTV